MDQLSLFERVVLRNQYELMGEMGIISAKEKDRIITILERGYQSEYRLIFGGFETDILEPEDCDYVRQVITMARNIVADHGDKMGELHYLQPLQFDMHNEYGLMRYAEFLIENSDELLQRKLEVIDSHYSTREIYTRMLRTWKSSSSLASPTQEDVERILSSASAPEE